MSNLLLKVQAISTGIQAGNKVAAARKQGDTLEDARAKVVEKLRLTLTYVTTGEVDKRRKTDLCIQAENGSTYAVGASIGTYVVGARYGIRWLPNLAGEGQKFFRGVKHEELVPVLEAVIEAVNGGECDSDLQLIQRENAERMRKAA